jgi:hypothetical protein
MVKKLGASLVECDADMKFVARRRRSGEKGKTRKRRSEQVAPCPPLRTSASSSREDGSAVITYKAHKAGTLQASHWWRCACRLHRLQR